MWWRILSLNQSDQMSDWGTNVCYGPRSSPESDCTQRNYICNCESDSTFMNKKSISLRLDSVRSLKQISDLCTSRHVANLRRINRQSNDHMRYFDPISGGIFEKTEPNGHFIMITGIVCWIKTIIMMKWPSELHDDCWKYTSWCVIEARW